MINVSSSRFVPNNLLATFNINERARLRFPVNVLPFGYEIVFETVHQYYICRFVEQFLALVIGDFTYRRKTAHMMRRLLSMECFDCIFSSCAI